MSEATPIPVDGTSIVIYEILRDRLYQSGSPDAEADWTPIHKLKIDVVIDLHGNLDPNVPTDPNSIVYVYWPIQDHPELPDLLILDNLTEMVVREIDNGHKVLVHCHKGKSRSGLFNAIVLMKVLGVSGKRAVQIVREKRPEALGNQSFAAYLESLPPLTREQRPGERGRGLMPR